MKAVVLSFIVLLSFSISGISADEKKTFEGSKKDLHVYLLIGQSNMAGRAKYNDEQAKNITNCFLLNSENVFESAANPFNRYSTIRKGLGMQKMNPGYNFALNMLKHNKKISIGLVVNAKGGTKIEQWAKGTKFYNDALKRLNSSLKKGTLKGILWHQGESNSKNPEGYLEKLQTLVKNLRSDLKEPKLPFVAGQIINHQGINDQIAKLPETLPHTSFVSSEGLKGADRWHFDTASMLKLGERYAEAMIKLQGK